MKNELKISLLIVLLISIIGCSTLGIQPMYIKNWSLIKTGMTKTEVEKTLGKPDSIVSEYKHDEGQTSIGKTIVNTLFDGWHEKWCYGKSSIATKYFLVPFGPPGNIYIVYFNKDDKVIGLRKPMKEQKQS